MNDVGRRAGIEVEHHHYRPFDVVLARKRRVQLEVGQVCGPNEGGKIVHETIVHDPLIAFAPDFCRLHPFWSMRRTVLFIKKFAFHSIGIALHSERPVFQVRQKHWGHANVIIDYLSFGETDFRIKHFVQVGDLNLALFYNQLRLIRHT